MDQLVRRIEVPGSVRGLSMLARADYADAFVLDVGPAAGHSGEEWARSAIEESPATVRLILRLGWATIGLELGAGGAPGGVFGWSLLHGDDDFALLGVDSRIGMPAEILFRPEGDTLLLCTFVEQRTPLAKAVWTATAPLHREIVPRLLAAARRRLGSDSP
jgi:hypothetical protein